MAMAKETLCMACGQPTGPKVPLGRLPDGRPCPSCADRLLDTLPPLLPAPIQGLDFEEWAEEEGGPAEDDFQQGA
jgi:hypothetical protein